MNVYKWIEAEEKTPNIGERVLVYPIDGEVEVAEYIGEGEYNLINGMMFHGEDITHWTYFNLPSQSVAEKAPGAKTNSYVTEIKGCASIFPKTLKGQSVNASVMFTSDERGEMLSVFDPSTKKQIVVPFEPVILLIEHTRNACEKEVQT